MERIDLGDDQADVDTRPGACPICGVSVHPHPIAGYFTISSDGFHTPSRWEIAFACPREQCRRVFIARYENNPLEPRDIFRLQWVAPRTFRPPEIDADVARVSPGFASVFPQATAAEHYGLSEVAGSGYRKALEFLVKDFCIAEKPGDRSTIETISLGRVIADFVDDPRIRDCALRAAWLGNDESHYKRKFEDRDVRDLKILIDLTVHWIQMQSLTKRFVDEMHDGGSSAGKGSQ